MQTFLKKDTEIPILPIPIIQETKEQKKKTKSEILLERETQAMYDEMDE